MSRIFLFILAAALAASCTRTEDAEHQPSVAQAPGATEALRTMLEGYDGLELIVTDLVIPPDAPAPRHYHPGEELVYMIKGSAIHVEDGQPDRLVTAGEAFVIPRGAVHAPRGGPLGARAILVHVVPAGEEVRVLVGEKTE